MVQRSVKLVKRKGSNDDALYKEKKELQKREKEKGKKKCFIKKRKKGKKKFMAVYNVLGGGDKFFLRGGKKSIILKIKRKKVRKIWREFYYRKKKSLWEKEKNTSMKKSLSEINNLYFVSKFSLLKQNINYLFQKKVGKKVGAMFKSRFLNIKKRLFRLVRNRRQLVRKKREKRIDFWKKKVSYDMGKKFFFKLRWSWLKKIYNFSFKRKKRRSLMKKYVKKYMRYYFSKRYGMLRHTVFFMYLKEVLLF